MQLRTRHHGAMRDDRPPMPVAPNWPALVRWVWLLLLALGALSPTPVNAQPLTNMTLTPFGYQNGISAYCTDSYGNFVPYCTPDVTYGDYTWSGGHLHDDATHYQTSPPGPYFSTVTAYGSLNTTTINYFLSIAASRTGEEEWIEACAYTCNTLHLHITFGLSQLYPGYNFILVGDTPWHPLNHWATPSTINSIVNIAQDYSSHYYQAPGYQTIGVNDEGINNGGVFDICETASAGCSNGVLPWQSPHIRHDYGKAADFRANGTANSILKIAFADFQKYCSNRGLGSYIKLESVGTSNEHIHCDGN